MVEARRTEVYNATGPAQELTMGDLLETCRQATGGHATFTWADEAFLLANGVAPWSELPLWLPEADNGVMAVDCQRAIAAGLAFRPLVETVQDTLAWLRAAESCDGDLSGVQLRAGMALGAARRMLLAWLAHQETAMTMITFAHDNIRFTHRIVGVAIEDGRVLLHQAEGDDFWALPGGRAELLEPAEDTLRREIREELDIEVEVVRPLWLVENFFQHQGYRHHELGIYFLMPRAGRLALSRSDRALSGR